MNKTCALRRLETCNAASTFREVDLKYLARGLAHWLPGGVLEPISKRESDLPKGNHTKK